MTNLEKMLDGKIYDGSDIEIQKIAKKAHHLCHIYNSLDDTDPKRKEILKELLPNAKDNIYLQGDIYFDYGAFTHIGNNFYANYGLRVLDTCPIYIGDNVYLGTSVSLLTPLHPLIGEERRYHQHEDGSLYDDEYGRPIHIGNDCWLASSVIVLPGVTIGDGVVIGAGSVVTHDIPSHSLAAGNPCKVIRSITKEDSIFLKRELFED